MEPSDVGYPALSIAYWVNELTELAYEIDDSVDKLIHKDIDGSKIRRICNKLREKLNPLRWLTNDNISEFRSRLIRAIQRHRDFHLDRWTLKPGVLSDEHPPLLPLVTKVSGLVGLDSSVETISGWLAGNEGVRLNVVAIAGIGGVGKTTLAKELYSKLRGQLECRAFVRASQKPDMRKLLTNLLLQVRRHQHMDVFKVPDLINEIRAHLRYKKYFIILDDLWPPSTWHIISAAFPDGDHGSRILVTTKVDSVAQECCGHNSKRIFYMEPLNDKASSELFSESKNHLRDFMVNQSEALREIISECRGLPLAIINTASVLASQPCRIEQWKGDYMHHSSSINWATNPELEGLKLVLCLSYNALPHRLKACMLYLCTYKEEYIILKDNLVKQWVAEGFVSAIEGKGKEEVAGYYFDKLVHRGMMQPVAIDQNDKVLSCTVLTWYLTLSGTNPWEIILSP